MKQRLLLSLLMLFVSVGLIQGANIKVTSNGKAAVTITVKGGVVTSKFEANDDVTVNSDKTVVTIAKDYADQVTIITDKTVSEVSFSGEMTTLDINGGDALTTINFGSSKVKTLTVAGKAITALNCSGLGLANLTLDATSLGKLTKVDVSGNELSNGMIANLANLVNLQELDLSGNEYSGDLDLSSLSTLTKLDVSDNDLTGITLPSDGKLTSVNLDGNQIKTATIPDGCKADWGTQTIKLPTAYIAKANIGVQVNDLLEAALIEEKSDASISGVTWQVLKGTEYVEDNKATAHESDYKGEYHFYNSTDGYVKGNYQCTFTYNERKYAVQNIEIWHAEFTGIKVVKPTNAKEIKVYVDGTEQRIDNITFKQTQKVKVVVTPEDGYDEVTYAVKGLVAADGSAAPYKGKSFDFVVKAMYNEVPELSATVAAAGRKVVYDEKSTTQVGGSFTVEKITGSTTSGLKAGESVNTGDQLLITVKPNTGYKPSLMVGDYNLTENLVLTEDNKYATKVNITEDKYPAGKDVKIVVSFSNAVTITAVIDEKNMENAPEYLVERKIAIVDGTSTKYIEASSDVTLSSPNTSYTARFILAKGYRLQDDAVIINGGKCTSLTKVQDKQGIKYEVIFSVESSNVTLSIKTAKLQEVTINPNTDKVDSKAYQIQVYDGKQKSVAFTTTPQLSKESIVVNYKEVEPSTFATIADLGEKAPTNAGTYLVELKLADDAAYTYTASDASVYLIIDKAPLEIELPNVTVGEDGLYDLTGGKATFNGKEVAGTWKVNVNENKPEGENATKSHSVDVIFTPTSATDQSNFKETEAKVNVKVGDTPLATYTVDTDGTLPAGYSIEYYNGSQKLSKIDQLAADATLTIVVTYPKGTKGVTLKVTSTQLMQPVKDKDASVDGRDVYTFKLSNATYTEAHFSVSAGTGKSYKITFEKDLNNPYTGSEQWYDFAKCITVLDADGKRVDWATIERLKPVITYKSGTTEVFGPKDAGKYTVSVTIPYSATSGYVECSVTGTDVFEIVPVKAKVTEWPEASVIAKGMPLSYSDLTNGVVSIEGKFSWEDENVVPATSGEHKYNVVFTPSEEYAKNYTSVTSEKPISVVVSDLQIVAYSQPAEATIEVSKNGTVTKPGAPIVNGDKLAITVTPKTDWEVTSITVNGQSCSFTQSNGKYVASYTVGEVSAAIEATFKAKSTEVTDPNSQYKVTVTESVRGAIISKPGDNVVKLGSDFDFTVSTLAADASKVVVKVDGTTLKPTNGKYVIQDVKKNTTVTVSLPNPTPLKVEVQKDYLNANKYHIGQVEIIDGEATTYYYGDVITVMADPEDGVKFVKWSDGSTDKIHEITLKADTKVVASFSGVPTGIEDIESAAITTGKGFIMVKNVANAKVTVVSISGRLQAQEEVSGDTRIDVPQGIYVVVLESGSDVKRTKVIVK